MRASGNSHSPGCIVVCLRGCECVCLCVLERGVPWSTVVCKGMVVCLWGATDSARSVGSTPAFPCCLMLSCRRLHVSAEVHPEECIQRLERIHRRLELSASPWQGLPPALALSPLRSPAARPRSAKNLPVMISRVGASARAETCFFLRQPSRSAMWGPCDSKRKSRLFQYAIDPRETQSTPVSRAAMLLAYISLYFHHNPRLELVEVHIVLLGGLGEAVLLDGLDGLGGHTHAHVAGALLPPHAAGLQVHVLHLLVTLVGESHHYKEGRGGGLVREDGMMACTRAFIRVHRRSSAFIGRRRFRQRSHISIATA
mmetsp:Transcript_35241/g.110947  ORF Transcript_35241/g.110947 Transcript_35241/m.110947 type:complete len:313 (+) Transcript_35241:537-1475(+)